MSNKKNTYEKKTGRSADAMSACFRHADFMRHRTAPRGGAVNEQRNLMEEYGEETVNSSSLDDIMVIKDEILDSDPEYQLWLSRSV